MSLTNRAAPPGSMRYFSLLYTAPQKRDAVTALYAIDAEIRESAESANHDVAHTRLQWWRQEIDRLAHGNPLHPATRTLATQFAGLRGEWARLHELIAAADMDLARMTYLNREELRAYSVRSGGAVLEMIARVLLAPRDLDESARAAANQVGAGVRRTEMLRDIRQDAYDGRLYLPLDDMGNAGITLDHLREREVSPAVKQLLRHFGDHIASELQAATTSIPATMRSHLRPLLVLAALHRRLLKRIAARRYEVASERIELGPVEKPWVAWRAARKG